MKPLERVAHSAAMAALALAAFGAGTASATALEVGGVAQEKSVTVLQTVKSGTSVILKQTDGTHIDTCSSGTRHTTTAHPYRALYVNMVVLNMELSNCTHTTKVIKGGNLLLRELTGTNGTVSSSGEEMTVQTTTFGITATCTTSNTHLGTLTGVKEGDATVDVNAVVNCGFFLPTVVVVGTWTVTSPKGLGVVP